MGAVLRLDVRQSSFDGSWGVQIERVAVRDASGAVTDFVTADGQWLGPAPGSAASGAAGVAAGSGQMLRLMPAGLSVATFPARWVGAEWWMSGA